MKPFTVSEINSLINSTLQHESVLQNCLIKGTITNLKRHSSGHYYFSLKDEKASVEVALFRNSSRNKAFVKEMENGILVTIVGSVNYYEPWGKLTIICQDMIVETKSPLQIKFEALKKELSALGYFDEAHKQPIPYMPKCIGIVTSASGAVLHDILNVAKIRNPLVDFKLFSVPVQGNTAGETIAKGITMADNDSMVDLIIVGRGGGSMEDLWCFNDRLVVEALYKAKTPTISAVGHETDYTLCDFAADVRSSTPSHAAELAIVSTSDLEYALQEKKQYIYTTMNEFLQKTRQKLMEKFSGEFLYPLLQTIKQQENKLLIDKNKMRELLVAKIYNYEKKLALFEQELEFLNPKNVLNKGYTKISVGDKGITSVKQLNDKDLLVIPLVDGVIKAEVKEIEYGE